MGGCTSYTEECGHKHFSDRDVLERLFLLHEIQRSGGREDADVHVSMLS